MAYALLDVVYVNKLFIVGLLPFFRLHRYCTIVSEEPAGPICREDYTVDRRLHSHRNENLKLFVVFH